MLSSQPCQNWLAQASGHTKNHMLKNYSKSLFVLALILCPAAAFSETAELSTVSIVHTSHWFNWNWESSLPEDVVTFPISGTLNILIEEGGINPFTGSKDPDTIKFENIDITPFEQESNEWVFPVFSGTFVDSEIIGSEDPCFNFTSPGSCFSLGNFGWFRGTLVNDKLLLKGGKDPYITDQNTNSYYYEIEARIIKENPGPAGECKFFTIPSSNGTFVTICL